MKKTRIATALFALLSTNTFADTATPETLTAPVPAQNAAEPAATAPPAVPAEPKTLDCNYHVSPDTKDVSQKLITQWAEKAAIQSFSFAPDSFKNQLDSLKACFTDKGWNSFNDALDKSGNIKAIQSQQLTVSSQVEGTPSFATVKDNRWKVTIPMEVVYQNSSDKITQVLKVDLLIGRKMSGDLGIMQVIATPQLPPENKTEEAKPETKTTSTM